MKIKFKVLILLFTLRIFEKQNIDQVRDISTNVINQTLKPLKTNSNKDDKNSKIDFSKSELLYGWSRFQLFFFVVIR